MTRRALIVGVSGQDGAYLSRLLLTKGYDVHGTSRGGSPGLLRSLGIAQRVTMHLAEPTDFEAIRAVFQSFSPDEIYYLACQSSVARSFHEPIETWRSAALGLLTVLDVAQSETPAAKILHAGSGECFGETYAHAPATECSDFAPRSPYAAAKCAAHHAVAAARVSTGQFACTSFLYSHESPLRPEAFVVGKVIAAAKRISAGSSEKVDLGNISIARDWGWAPDYVEAMWRMLQQPEPLDLVIATGRSHRLVELVEAIFASAGLDWRQHVRVGAVPPRPSDIASQFASPKLAAEKIGWHATTTIRSLADRLLEPVEAIGSHR